jgi:serine/threonine-protein kinase
LNTVAHYHPGDTISERYQLEELLGEGGMGAVWRARNLALDAPVAIKVISSEVEHPTLRQRLLIEARAAAKLTHPAIVKVFDVGETERSEPYIVMELLKGTSLGAILRDEGRLSAVQAVRTLLPIADALQVAHAKGIVHRDLKPDNIFIVHDARLVQPKLVDFGVVKVQQAEGPGTVTRDGVVMGSPTYLSPEQACGADDIDQRADVWAFAVVLFEVISGRAPFKAANYNALLRQIVEDTPPTLRALLVADEALSAIVTRGLRKPREERFQSMAEMGRALARWLFDTGETQDICGTALETKWLRQPDPSQNTSVDAPWRGEPGSGIRRPVRLPASTIPAPAPDTATTEHEPIPAATQPSRSKHLLVIGGFAAAAALAVFWGKQQNTAAVATPATPSVTDIAVPPVASSVPPSPSTLPAVEPAPPASASVVPAAPPAPPSAKASARSIKKPASQEQSKPPPTSDLLRPY